MAVLLPDTLKTMTDNFPAAEAKDVEITLTGNIKKRLQKAYEDGDLGGGEGLMAVETMPPNPEDGDTVLYTGTTGVYIKGHIYKYREYDNFYAYAEDGEYFVYVKDVPPSVGDDFYTVSSEEHKAKNASELNLVEGYSISEVNGDNIKTTTGDGTYTRDSNADLGSYWEDITLSGIELVYDSSEIPANPEDNDVMFYLGDNTSTFTKNHFYKYIYSNDVWEDVSSKIIKDVETLPSGSSIEDILYRTSKNVLTGTERTINITSEEAINSVIADFRAAFPTWTYETDGDNVYLRCPENEMWDLNDSGYPEIRGEIIDYIYFFIPATLWDVYLKSGSNYRYNTSSNISNNFREYTKEFTIYIGSSNNQSLDEIALYRDIKESNVISIKSISELPADSEIPENLEKGNIYILSQDDNDVKAGTMYAIGAMETPSDIASTYHYKFTNGIKTIYSSSGTIGTNNVYVQSDNGYLFTALVNISGNTYRPALYEDDTSGVWDFNVNLPSTDEAVPTIAGWIALNEDTTTELAEQALAIASTASLQAKEAKDAITPHFTGTRNEVNSAISQNKLPDGAYVAVTDDIDQDYDTDYSTNEVKLANRWIDGKPIYRKVVDFGVLPNADTKSVAHNISNVDTFIYVNGVAKQSDHTAIPVNYINPTAINNSIGLYVNSTNVTIVTTTDLRAYANTYVFLEYTKSTD